MCDAVPALLGSLQLWVDSGAGTAGAERKELIRSAVDQIERQMNVVSFLSFFKCLKADKALFHSLGSQMLFRENKATC